MKHIQNFSKFINESQSKKLKKYFTFSTVLTWYRENKEKIANVLGIDVSEMASEDDLLTQSYGLVNHVINRQDSGNTGNVNTAGFAEFDKLEKNLIHDILHNLYQVQSKHFEKSLDKVEYTESEIIEEIECLGIEESFMKYMNIRYPKTDFINQNINMLVSHLMLSILKYDTQRVVDIIEGDVEPYIEVYGKKYPVAGTPFEGLFDLYTRDDADSKFEIKSERDLREYLIHLINVGRGIGESGGDRGQYPSGEFFGSKSFYELDDYTKHNYYEDIFDDKIFTDKEKRKYRGYYASKEVHTFINIDDDGIVFLDDLKRRGLYTELRPFVKVVEDDSDAVDYGEDPNQLEIDFKKANESSELAGEFNYMEYLKVKIERMKRHAEKHNQTVEDSWQKIKIEDDPEEYIFEFDDKRYIAWDKNNYLISKDKIEEIASEEYNSGDSERYDDDHKFIDFNEYRKKTTKELVDFVLSDDDSKAILRRNFRTNDIVRNNTKIGQHDSGLKYDKNYKAVRDDNGNLSKSFETERSGYVFYDFEGKYSFPSLSKMLTTENAQILANLLNQLRGYVIKNIDSIKANTKEMEKKFNKEDIELFRNIKFDAIKTIFEEVKHIKTLKKMSIRFNSQLVIEGKDINIEKFLQNIKEVENAIQLVNKIENKNQLDYLFNWVNKGSVQNYAKFEELVNMLKDENFINHLNHLINDLTDNEKKFINAIKNHDYKSLYLYMDVDFDYGSLKTKKDIEKFIKNLYSDSLKSLGSYKMIVYWNENEIKEFLESEPDSRDWYRAQKMVNKVIVQMK